MGYSFYRSITIDHTKAGGSDSSNFPALFSGTYAYLATVANGGKVQNASGFDIIFAADSAGTMPLNFERVVYTPATGLVEFWVKIPTLSHSSDTVIYILYGNSSISTDQSSGTSVWDANYKAVYHLSGMDVPFVGTVPNQNDSTANANTLTGVDNPVNSSAGKINGCYNTRGLTTEAQQTPGLGTFSNSSLITLEAWGNLNTLSQREIIIGQITVTGDFLSDISVDGNSTNKFFGQVGKAGTGGDSASGTTVASTGTWYHLVMTADGSTVRFYVNGVQEGTGAYSNANTAGANSKGWFIGKYRENGSDFFPWDSLIDEVRFSLGVVRSADWILAEYNNQNSPSTFYSISAETAVPIARGNIDYDQLRLAARHGTGAQLQMFGSGFSTTGHVGIFDANSNLIDGGLPVNLVAAPAAHTSSGVPGQVAYDNAGNFYWCYATNSWARIGSGGFSNSF